MVNTRLWSFRASLVSQLVRIHLQYRRPGFDPWVGKIPWRKERLPTPVFWPREFHGLYSPWVAKSRTQLSNFHNFISFLFVCLFIHLLYQKCELQVSKILICLVYSRPRTMTNTIKTSINIFKWTNSFK